MVTWIKALHEKYGNIVRLSPTELSFISAETAWPDVYGPRTGKYKNTGPYSKDQSWFLKPLNKTLSLLAADEVAHPRVRRSLAHAFSDKALRGQEPLVQQHVDLLVQRLGEQETEDEPVDIMRWYNFTTFDVMCDLSFGEPLYCLRDNKGMIVVYVRHVKQTLTSWYLHLRRAQLDCPYYQHSQVHRYDASTREQRLL
jgi:cytochrome P450